MLFTLNCLFLEKASAQSIPVIISEKTPVPVIISKKTFVDNIKYEDITVLHVKSLILFAKKYDSSLDKLNLWKVDHDSVNENDEKIQTFSTKDEIKEKLGDEFM